MKQVIGKIFTEKKSTEEVAEIVWNVIQEMDKIKLKEGEEIRGSVVIPLDWFE